MKKENVEVIEMQQTTFVQRHAKKILFATGVVVAAGAYYMLKKHDLEITKLTESNVKKDEEINFIKFLVIESDCVAKAVQNAENKLARKENKIKALIDALDKCPNDIDLVESIKKHEKEANILRYQLSKTYNLNELILNDENIYAK